MEKAFAPAAASDGPRKLDDAALLMVALPESVILPVDLTAILISASVAASVSPAPTAVLFPAVAWTVSLAAFRIVLVPALSVVVAATLILTANATVAVLTIAAAVTEAAPAVYHSPMYDTSA